MGAIFYPNKPAWMGNLKSRFDLLTLLDTFQSALKRDRFFELLGMALGGNEEELVPRYGSIGFTCITCRYGQGFVRQGHGENS